MLVVIDPSVVDVEVLAAGVVPDAQVLILDPDQDAIAQITNRLQGHQAKISSLHIVVHGSPGTLHFTSGSLSLSNLERYSAELATWPVDAHQALQILLYSCHVACEQVGDQFLTRLHHLTQANVQAANTWVGKHDQQRRWSLAVTRGEVTSNRLAFNPDCLASYNGKLTPIAQGTYDTPGSARDVKILGNYAYIADETSGLQIVDITDPANPTLKGVYSTSDSAQGVALSGNYAYVANNAGGLQIVDITDPANPIAKGTYNTSDATLGVAVAGNYAYIADGINGFEVIDITDPANPTAKGNYNTSGYARDVSVSGNYAYVADGNSGLQVIDITDPANPVLKGTYNTSGYALGVVVSGSYAYVADVYSGLQIIDITDPTNPVLKGTYDTPGAAQGIAIAGNYAYIADGNNGLQIIDISDPTAPIFQETYDTTGAALGVAVADDYAYVADGTSGLQIIFPFPTAVEAVSANNADGIYGTSELIDVTVQFSDVVTVTGTPSLTLETGDSDRQAIYKSGSGTDTLVFQYLVQPGDKSPDLDYLSINALAVHSGTIQDSRGKDAVLTLPSPGAAGSLGANKDIRIGNTEVSEPQLISQENNLLSVISGNATQLKANVSSYNASDVWEIILVPVDDSEGTVDGKKPGDADYLDAITQKALVVLSVLQEEEFSQINFERILDVADGQFLQLAAIRGNSLDDLRRGNSAEVLFATSQANSNDYSAVKFNRFNAQTVEVGFRLPGSSNFSDLTLQLTLGDFISSQSSDLQGKSSESEIIDLTGLSTPVVNANIEVFCEADFSNVVGFYTIEDQQGSVRDPLTGNLLKPGEAGYLEAALANRINLNIAGKDGQVTNYSTQITTGKLLTTFIVVDGTIEALLDSDLSNDPTVYFNHIGSNSDGKDHVRLLGDNIFGYEDLANGGDMDFDDAVVKITFTDAI